MKKIIYTGTDGVLRLVSPPLKERLELTAGPLTQAEYEARVILKGVPRGLSYRLVEDADLPLDRVLRLAWADDGVTVTEDKVKSQAIVRAVRDKALEKLDDQAFVESRKPRGSLAALNIKAQSLRDIPQREAFVSGNPEDLKSMIAEIEVLQGD